MEAKDLTKKQFNIFSKEGKNNFVEVYFYNENIWLSQKLMSLLFDVKIPAIAKHLKNIFEEKELEENKVVSILEIPYNLGHSKGIQYQKVKFYNLDAIISIGYRVNSKNGMKAIDCR